MAENTKTPAEKKAKPKAKVPALRDEHGRFIKGASGNPGGRPPEGDTWRDLLEEAGQQKRCFTLNGKRRKLTRKQIVSQLAWESCVYQVRVPDKSKKTGYRVEYRINEKILKLLMERMDGPTSAVNINLPGDGQFIIETHPDLDE